MKKKLTSILALVLVFMLATVGCSQKSKTIKDREGNDVTLPKKMDRIISTAPSNTEVLVDLGLADKLVAVDKYSTDIEGINKDIEKIDFLNPDAEAIIALNPDIIIASGHNKTGSSEDPFKLIKEAGISVVYIPSSESIQGIYDDIMFLADITDKKEKGQQIVDNMKKEVDEIKAIGETIKDKKKVYFEIGPAPNLYSFGNSTFLNEMIELVGAENVFKDEKAWISPSEESVIDKNPDVILTNVGYIKNPLDEIKSRNGWNNITAVKDNKVFLIDKNASSRPSHHAIKALKEMAVAIYPESYK
ncbi:ABC transporter substrate-binding protein [Romboutsia lituseburensis]|uniref:Iron complex transport system substrate-binding protein n=1 Tax=Romboutsia lituseburensis DSM 797 TaxID=1121325 RepID=A0A1G9MDS8_9FIRM|nr:ABC transporter substrate-binding protein [Romboutsia lituseburensis]CEH34500.1 Periplasmic binding protein [Romboutsia lituseburensis]SDL72416.1 iron complex transport system substrate-binding protein [Romboutsia lituseburensis DSM 797]